MGVAALLVLVGFSRTFYLRAWFDAPPLSALRYRHGVLMTTWYALFLAQVLLVSRRRVDVHRQLGVFAVLVAAAIVPVGSATAIAFIHPAFGWGGALFLISSRLAVHAAISKQWIDYALRTFA